MAAFENGRWGTIARQQRCCPQFDRPAGWGPRAGPEKHRLSRGMALRHCATGGADRAICFFVLFVSFPLYAHAFYLPGVAPTDYTKGEELSPKVSTIWFFSFRADRNSDHWELQVEALTSVRTQLPYEYYVLPFCRNGASMLYDFQNATRG